MTADIPDHEMRELLSDAVSDVDATHRLDDIRARTARPDRRSRWYVAGGAVLAAAAAVTAFAVVSDLGANDDGPDPATPDGTAIERATRAVPAYFVGETPIGPRLYREFVAVDADLPKAEAALAALEGGPQDPDYTSSFGPESFAETSVKGDVIYVDLADESLHDRPSDMSKAEAGLAVEQVLYSLQGALEVGRLPVQFRLNGNPINEVYGVPTSEPVSESPQLDVLALVSISDPGEGTVVGDTLFTAKGAASSFEATVPWEIRDADGTVVLNGFATAEGWIDKLYPWETEIDVSGLDPGTYTFVALTDDPSDGEGVGPTLDTRTIVVE